LCDLQSSDELDVEDFRHGGANITGFRLVNPAHLRTKDIQREWSKLNSALWPGAGDGHQLQLEAALTIDAVTSVVDGLSSLLKADLDAVRDALRRGKVWNNGTLGIQCKKDSPVWKLGVNIMKHLKQVCN
jgi:ionotropic glutamate receptor